MKKRDKYTTLSYPRSGSHFIRNALNKDFGYVFKRPGMKHGFTPYNIKPDVIEWYKNYNTIYIIRDPRDAIISLYDWFGKSFEEIPEKFTNESMNDYTFSNFIRGKSGLEHKNKIIAQAIIDDPITYWVEHTAWLKQDWFYDVIKYEDAIKTWKINELVYAGNNSKGISGRWKKYFTDEDLEYFWNIAGERMKELDYEKGKK